MTPKDVLNHFKSAYNFRKETGMSSSTLLNWLRWGFIPEDSQYRIERLTKGVLKTQWSNQDGKN